jgi:hypothetical protein
MRLHGHLVEIDWDGAVLDVRGTNADGRALVNAGTDDGRLHLPATEIDEVVFRDAPRHVGGVLLVIDTAGAEHRLHFRRGGREAFHALYEELEAAAESARSERPVIDLTEPVDQPETAEDPAYDELLSH